MPARTFPASEQRADCRVAPPAPWQRSWLMIPDWLHNLSIAYLSFGGACALAIAADDARHPQHMWIMNVVWPVTALFGTAWVLWQYFTYGRLATHARAHAAMQRG